MKTPKDDWITRCPRLGQEITLGYCLKESDDLPCARIVACWQSLLDVPALLDARLNPEARKRFETVKPVDKVASLVELIEKARRST